METNMTNLSVPIPYLWSHPLSKGFRRFFYLMLPSESSFEYEDDVPDYVNQAIPYFLFFVFLEQTVLYFQDKPNLRLNDAFSSVSAGLVNLLPLVVMKNTEIAAYQYVHSHYRITELPWDSPWTWFFAFLAVDFGYYWAHRMGHEVNFMWAAHQAHHSSEEYNLTTALRQGALLKYKTWIFYLPLALFAPVTTFMVHIQFNLLYQFWIHTEVIKSLGPLEYILNTPSHHRVHHGRNRYCIDKNFGGTLIIWDRIFGTFAWEDEEVAYGLVHPLASWDVLYVQLCWWKHMIAVAAHRKGVRNKIMTFVNGPGWEPGKPRLGLQDDIPMIHPALEKRNKYDKSVSVWCHVYLHVHLTIAVVTYVLIVQHKSNLSLWDTTFALLFVLWTLTNIGYIYEHKWYASSLELLRCAIVLLVDTYLCIGAGSCGLIFYFARVIYIISTTIWTVQCLGTLYLPSKKPKNE